MTPYKVLPFDSVKQRLDPSQNLYFDTETDGLYGEVTLAQFYQESWEYVILVPKPDLFRVMRLLNRAVVIMHNASYDISTIQAQTKTDFVPKHYHDTLLLSRLRFHKKQSFSLDAVMEYSMRVDPYKDQKMDKKELQKTKWGEEQLTDEQLAYAATDVYYLPNVFKECEPFTPDMSYQLDMVTLNHCLKMQNHGMPVDRVKLCNLRAKNNRRLEVLSVPINVNSYRQVRKYIGKDESDGLALASFALDGNWKAGNVKEARGLLKLNNFLDKFDSKRIYGKFAPNTRSGRLSCTDQNLQQIPRATKGVFGVGEGRVLVYADFSQLELRVACAVIGEKKMAELFRSGEDLHTYTSDLLFGEGGTKEQRTIAKVANFNLTYGGSHGMLGSILLQQAGLRLPESELKDIKAKWLNLWKDIAKWQRRGSRAHNNKETWQTTLGRKYVGKQYTDQLNIQIQGGGADVAKIAFNNIMKQLDAVRNVKICNFVHDSYIVECGDDPEIYKTVAHIIGTSMKNAWAEMSKYFEIKDLPMPVEVLVGDNWGDIESGKGIIYKEEL